MADELNEDTIETAETTEEPTEEALDAELQAEYDRQQAIVDGTATEEEEEAEPVKAEADKEEPAKPKMSDEEADDLVRQYAKDKGWEVTDPNAVKKEEEAKDKGRQEANVDLLEGLPDVMVPQEVLDEIDKRYPGDENARKREVLYINAAVREQIRQEAGTLAKEAVAPIAQEREQATWQAKAQATARDIATKAEVPEAQEALTKIIMEAGPDAEERYKTDPLFKKMMDATLKMTVMEVADSLGSQEQKELPRAERVGGGKPEAAATMDGLTGEAKAMANEIKKDLADNLITKAEADQMLKSLHKEAARQ